HDFLTGEEFVDMAARLCGVPSGERGRRVAETLDLVGLGDARRRRLRTYSKGMTQRVGIAQAIVASPDLIILDQPMTGLDPIGRRGRRPSPGGGGGRAARRGRAGAGRPRRGARARGAATRGRLRPRGRRGRERVVSGRSGGRIEALAWNGMRQAVRDKVLYVL